MAIAARRRTPGAGRGQEMRRVERPSGSQTGRAIRRPPRGLAGAGAALGFFAILSLASLLTAQPASAVPSFARQTGQPCAACHTAFPELTPFGRRFKLSGYTLQGGDSKLPPIAAMIMPGFTHTQAPYDPGSQPAGLKTNDNLVVQQVTGLLAGQIYGNLGSFIQVSGNPVTGQTWFDASDVRYVDTFKLFGADAYFGVTVNNTPTVQDAWNTTTPGFPGDQLGNRAGLQAAGHAHRRPGASRRRRRRLRLLERHTLRRTDGLRRL